MSRMILVPHFSVSRPYVGARIVPAAASTGSTRILRETPSWRSAVLDRSHGRTCPPDVRRTSNTGKTTARIGAEAEEKIWCRPEPAWSSVAFLFLGQSMTTSSTGKPSLIVELTSYCNQRCAHCHNAFDHAHTRAFSTDELLFLLGRALDEVAFERVDFSGGEPSVHDGLLRAIELCSARDVRANVITKATLMTDDLARQLARFPPLAVQVTLNGPNAETHDAAVGLPGAWPKAIRGIVAPHTKRLARVSSPGQRAQVPPHGSSSRRPASSLCG